MWNYCTLTHDQLVKFAFAMYDLDNSGDIDRSEIRELVLAVFGKAEVDANTQAMLKRMDTDASGTVSLKEFRVMEKNAQTILNPCFLVQHAMVSKCGRRFWNRQKQKRLAWAIDNNDGEDMDIMDLHRGMYDIPEKAEMIDRRDRRKSRRAKAAQAYKDKHNIHSKASRRRHSGH